MRREALEEYDELVRRLIKCLVRFEIDYAFTGALAVSYYGLPRTTNDVDVMIAVKADSGVRIVFEALRCADLDIDEQRINEIMKSGYRIANFPDKKSHYNVDIIFSSEKIEKLTGRVAGLKTFLQKPEGLIAAKLRMIKATLPRERALKDEEDVKAILQFTKVDLDSIKQRAKLDGTQDILEYLIRSD